MGGHQVGEQAERLDVILDDEGMRRLPPSCRAAGLHGSPPALNVISLTSVHVPCHDAGARTPWTGENRSKGPGSPPIRWRSLPYDARSVTGRTLASVADDLPVAQLDHAVG